MDGAMMLGRGRYCCKSSTENDRDCKRDFCLDEHALDFLLARLRDSKGAQFQWY
jgi:hypothetical protein